jgi:AraC-like DNA-binding protein
MKAAPTHHSQVIGSPWAGVFCTHIDSARHYGRHWHATFGVGLLEDGAQRSASGRGQVEAFAGDVITTNPGEVHDGQPLGGPSRRWRMLYLEADAFASMMEGVQGEVEITRPVMRDPALAAAVHRLIDRLGAWHSSAAPLDAHTLACEESLVDACTLLRNHHTSTAPAREATADLRGVRERLADDLLNAPSLAELAAMAGLSRFQLLRRFEKTHGVPPHAWLLQQRAEHARRLIRQGTSLADAAMAAGFADQSHMTRVFTRQFGFTPGAWRQAAAGSMSTRSPQ